MDKIHHHLVGKADGPRMLYRSAYIYILLMAAIHLALSFFSMPLKGYKIYVKTLISVLAIVASMLVLIGFFIEPGLTGLQRLFTHFAIYAIFGIGVLLTFLGIKNTVE